MSIYVRSSNPQKLVNDINEKIENSFIDTWSVDSDGDYTHTAEQWMTPLALIGVFQQIKPF